MIRPYKQLVVVGVWTHLIGCLLAAVIRNPSDIHDIIDLDKDYLKYHPYHFNDDVTSTQYHFRLNKGDNYVPLHHNPHIDLNAPMCYLQYGNVICELGTEKNVHFYHDDSRSVAVAISNENGTMKMKGIVNTDNHTVDIDPVEGTGVPSNRYHVIKKRWTANIIPEIKSRSKRQIPKKKANQKNKNKKNCNSCKNGVHIQIGIGFGQRKVPNSQYKKIPSIKEKRPESSSYCIDILCVVDYSIYRKFLQTEKTPSKTMKKIRYYYAHVINGVNMRYASITTKSLEINVRLAGYFIAKSPRDLKFIDAKKMQKDSRYRVDSNYTLTSLDAFLKKLQKKQAKRRRGTNNLPDFNHATLFLEYASTNIGGSVLDQIDDTLDKVPIEEALQHGPPTEDDISGDKGGTSFVSGICSRTKSTSLVVDHGAYTSAGIATHELGHNLGVFFHDGEGTARSSNCKSSFNYIMAPASFLIDQNNLKYSFSFSPCSIKQITDNLQQLVKINRNCLQCAARDRSSVADVQVDKEFRLHLETLPGQVDDVHVQCQQLYGKGSFMCPPKSPEEMCYRMYCYDPKRGACAIISEQMAATGTPCGKYKICHMGKCIRDSVRGVDALDDCPYPDLPSKGAHCEDATPFMCDNAKFRQKCCQSCNKKFTPEESCKDSHIIINNFNCTELMKYITPSTCRENFQVKNYCCLSCKRLLLRIPANGGMIHIGIGVRNRQVAPSSRNSRGPGRNNYLANKSSYTDNTSSQKSKSKPGKQPKQDNKGKAPTGNCVDNPYVIINGDQRCPQIAATNCRYCQDPQIGTQCCLSCSKVCP